MTWKRSVVIALGLLVWSLGQAFAEVRQFEVSADLKCTVAQTSEGDPGKITVSVLGLSGVTLSGWTLEGNGSDDKPLSRELSTSNGVLTVSVDLSVLKSDSTITVRGKAKEADVTCPPFRLSGARPSGIGQAAQPSSADTSIDQAAALWLVSPEGRSAMATLSSTLTQHFGARAVAILPHLPSGSVGPLYPTSLAETTALQVAFVIDVNDRKARIAGISNIVCPEREGLPIDGSLKPPTTPAGAQSNDTPPPVFALLPLGRLLECGSGDARYKVQMKVDGVPSGDPIDAAVKLRPVYQLAATFAVGFDSATPPSYGVADKKVVEERNAVGPKVYAGFIWYPAGIDYDHVTWANRIAPFLFFDPKAISENFVVGAALTAKGRISIPIGLSVHRLKVPDGTKVGADFTGDGAVKTKSGGYGRDGLGVFIGVSFRADDFWRVKSAAAAK